MKLADFGFACSFATEQTDDGKFKVLPVDMISREQISMEVCVSSQLCMSAQLICLCLYCVCSFALASLKVLLQEYQPRQQAHPQPHAARSFGGFLVSAPECLEGQPGLQCDMFSLGLMLWDMCIGRHACQGRTASSGDKPNTEDPADRNDRLRYDHMFHHCVSAELRAENVAKRIPFWMCPHCSHVEQLKATLCDQPQLFDFIMSCLHPDPQLRITPPEAIESLWGTHTPFTAPDPDRQNSLSEAVATQMTLVDQAGNCATTFPKSLQDKSSRKFACLNLCAVTLSMSGRCKWLILLLKHMTDGHACSAGSAVAPSDRYRHTRELLIEVGLAHAISLFAEDLMSLTASPHEPDVARWQETLVNAIDFIVSAGEQDFYCAVSIILPPILRFLCAVAFTSSVDPVVASRAADIVCNAFHLVSSAGSNRTQPGAEQMELQQTLDDMQRRSKPGGLLGCLYCHQRCIDLLTLMCSRASTVVQPSVLAAIAQLSETPPSPPTSLLLAVDSASHEASWPPDLQLQLQHLHRLMQCVHIVLKEVKNRVNDKLRPMTPDKDAPLIAARKACDSPENSRMLFNIYHNLQLHRLQQPRQCDKQLKQLSELVLANCADILDVKSGAISIQDHIIGSMQEQAVPADVLHEPTSTRCFSRLVSLVQVAQKFFNFNSNFRSSKLAAPVPMLVPVGFTKLFKSLCDSKDIVRTRTAVLSARAADGHLFCVLVSIIEFMKESQAPASSEALLRHLASKQWNSSNLLTEQDVDVLQAFLRELYAAKPSVKQSAKKSKAVKQSKESKSRSPHAAFKHFKHELANKPLTAATEALLKSLRLPKSCAVGHKTIALAFGKLSEAVSGGASTVAAEAQMALYSLFALPHMFLSNALEAALYFPSLYVPLRDHHELGMIAMLQRLQSSNEFTIEWHDRYASVLLMQTLLLSLYSGPEQALLDHRCGVFSLLNDIVAQTLRPKNLDAINAARKLQQHPDKNLQSLYAETDWMQYVTLSDEDTSNHPTSNHPTKCQLFVKTFSKQLAKLGFSAEEARSLFTSQFDFPVSVCRTLCTCWCLMVSRHGPSLFASLGMSCWDAMRCILGQVPLSCLQAKICALDMVLAVCKHCAPDQLQAGGAVGLQSLLLPLLEDVVKSVQAPSAISADELKHLTEFTRALTPPTQLVYPSVNGWY